MAGTASAAKRRRLSARPAPPVPVPPRRAPTQHEDAESDEVAGRLRRQGSDGQVRVEDPEVTVQEDAQGHGAGAGAARVQDVDHGHHHSQGQLRQAGHRGAAAARPLQQPQQRLHRRRRDGPQGVGLRGQRGDGA